MPRSFRSKHPEWHQFEERNMPVPSHSGGSTKRASRTRNRCKEGKQVRACHTLWYACHAFQRRDTKNNMARYIRCMGGSNPHSVLMTRPSWLQCSLWQQSKMQRCVIAFIILEAIAELRMGNHTLPPSIFLSVYINNIYYLLLFLIAGGLTR